MAWRINIPVLKREIDAILQEVPSQPCDVKMLFVRGEKSNYILESDFDKIKQQFTNADILTIHDAGHWIHAEKPEEFYNTVLNYFNV